MKSNFELTTKLSRRLQMNWMSGVRWCFLQSGDSTVEISHPGPVDGEPLQMDVVVGDCDDGRVTTSADNRRPGALYGDRGVWFPVPKALDVFIILGKEGRSEYVRLPSVSQ